MSYLVFVSYVRSDRDHFLERFMSDLRDEIRRKHAECRLGQNITFFDTRDIETGTEWEHALAAALRTSRTLLCLCSPGYFNSDYCGREFQVFCQRRENWMRAAKASERDGRVIFPILWELPRGPLPPAIARFQTGDDDFPPVYAAEGLRYMMKLNRYHDEYMHFVDRLAGKLVTACSDKDFPDADDLPPLLEVPNPFRAEKIRGASRVSGPNSAKFVFIAATASEIAGLRESLSQYGDESGWFWRPFVPGAAECVGSLAQLAATNLNLRYSEVPVSERLIQDLEEARRRNEAVVLVADPWTICVADYSRMMQSYDTQTLINCGVVVAWNDADLETTVRRPMLEQMLREAFPQKIILRPPGHEWLSVRSAGDFKSKLEETLTRIRMMIIQMSSPERKAESWELTELAAHAGIAVASKPTLWGPGGDPK